MPRSRTGADPIDVIIVDADASERRSLSAIIGRERRFRVQAHADRSEAQRALKRGGTGIVIADLDTVGGVADLDGAGQRTVIATSTDGSVGKAVGAVRDGAVDFLAKPIGARALLERLQAAATRSLRPQETEFARGSGPTAAEGRFDFEGFVGRSPPMNAVYQAIARFAPSSAPVFITGESGTGKDICATALHARSGRDGDAPFVAVNCCAMPRDLLESEMFGHEKGSFTGATAAFRGAVEQAGGGTLFLDEIADMDPGLQGKLLRFLQSGEYRRVGGRETRHADVRIIAATNRDPVAAVAEGRLRSDLFHRLHVLPIRMPPLRERPGDLARLLDHFIAAHAAEEGMSAAVLADDTLRRLETHDWPGNVRELANWARRFVVLGEADPPVVAAAGDAAMPTGTGIAPLHVVERAAIEAALAHFDGNVTHAAAALEVNPSTIHRKRRTWGVAHTG